MSWLGLKLPIQSAICAPMVDQSELAFRMLCRRYGVKLCYTPMLHSRIFVENPKYRKEKFSTCKEDRPLIVQFCGNDPETVLKAAKLVENDCDAIDLNLGCPQGIARKGNYGSFLLNQPQLVGEIVETLSKNIKVPITCKIRILPTLEKTLELCYLLEQKGCSLLTVHGRTKEENKIVSHANWEWIKIIKNSLKIPVVANGSIGSLEDLKRCLSETGVDGVMSSESLLENPALFCERENLPDGFIPSQIHLAKEYLDLTKIYETTPKMKRAHLFKLLHGPLKVHTDIRSRLGKSKVEDFPSLVEELDMLHDPNKDDSCTNELCKAFRESGSWYIRHRERNKKMILEREEKKRKRMELASKCSETGTPLPSGKVQKAIPTETV